MKLQEFKVGDKVILLNYYDNTSVPIGSTVTIEYVDGDTVLTKELGFMSIKGYLRPLTKLEQALS